VARASRVGLRVAKSRRGCVLRGEDRWAAFQEGPLNGEVGIIPPEGPVAGQLIILGALIEKVGKGTEDVETVGEAGRNPKLARILSTEALVHPATESPR
jgi:hypothetical protein